MTLRLAVLMCDAMFEHWNDPLALSALPVRWRGYARV